MNDLASMEAAYLAPLEDKPIPEATTAPPLEAPGSLKARIEALLIGEGIMRPALVRALVEQIARWGFEWSRRRTPTVHDELRQRAGSVLDRAELEGNLAVLRAAVRIIVEDSPRHDALIGRVGALCVVSLGMNQKEAAELVNCSPSAVSRQLARIENSLNARDEIERIRQKIRPFNDATSSQSATGL